jgi:hypothetical protein
VVDVPDGGVVVVAGGGVAAGFGLTCLPETRRRGMTLADVLVDAGLLAPGPVLLAVMVVLLWLWFTCAVGDVSWYKSTLTHAVATSGRL